MSFDRVAFVWGTAQGGEPAHPPSVSVSLWRDALDVPLLRWGDPADCPDLTPFDIFLVNVFPTSDGTHIEQIRAKRPDAKIIAMVDPTIDLILMNEHTIPMLRQLALADCIGGRTPADCQVYGSVFKQSAEWLPSPIGPTEFYLPYREVIKKQHQILALDHPMNPHQSLQSIAALTLIQHESDYEIVYAAAREITKQYAQIAGLRVEFREHVPFPEFVQLTAESKMCIDPYARTAYHRHAALCAMVGTPCITSQWTTDFGHPKVESPYSIYQICEEAEKLAIDDGWYNLVRAQGFYKVRQFDFEHSRDRMEQVINNL